jgi:hypothetical protein
MTGSAAPIKIDHIFIFFAFFRTNFFFSHFEAWSADLALKSRVADGAAVVAALAHERFVIVEIADLAF